MISLSHCRVGRGGIAVSDVTHVHDPASEACAVNPISHTPTPYTQSTMYKSTVPTHPSCLVTWSTFQTYTATSTLVDIILPDSAA